MSEPYSQNEIEEAENTARDIEAGNLIHQTPIEGTDYEIVEPDWPNLVRYLRTVLIQDGASASILWAYSDALRYIAGKSPAVALELNKEIMP